MNKNYLTYSIEELAVDEAFIRWVKGLDPEKDNHWETWLGQHPEKLKAVESAKKLVGSIQFKEKTGKKIDKNALWDKIDQSIQSKEKKDSKPRKPSVLRPLIWAAAATIAFFLIFKPFAGKETTIIAKAGEHLELQLPDQSMVELNAESEVIYYTKKWEDQRDVRLKGEAFFNVRKGKQFIVHTENGKVEVLGTSFNVLSREKTFTVFCKTGKVKVSASKGKATVTLTPGESVTLTENGILKNRNYDGDQPIEWMKGVFRFDGAPLLAVFETFERQYAVDIQSELTIDTMLYTGSFSRGEFEKALKDITWPMHLNTQIDGKIITVSK